MLMLLMIRDIDDLFYCIDLCLYLFYLDFMLMFQLNALSESQ